MTINICMDGQYNVWCKWHKLKTVVLGRCYPLEFFDTIKNDKIRSAMLKITEETLEDLEGFESVLKEFGCEVLRPEIDPTLRITDFIDTKRSIPRAPLQPRDCQFVCGKKLYLLVSDANGEFVTLLEDYNTQDIIDLRKHPRNEFFAYAASCTMVGKDLYVDSIRDEGVHSNDLSGMLAEQNPHMRVNTLTIGGHNDGTFHVLKPGVILSLFDIQQYHDTFPKWDVCYLKNQSWDLVMPFLKMKKKVNGNWWVPGEEENDEFINFVETWLRDWVGYCEESVFDVNVVMLDDRHVCVNNYNETVFKFLKKHRIEPIIVPWRHRYFWDGGLHCITLDLYREGQMEDYFPKRFGPISDPGFD